MSKTKRTPNPMQATAISKFVRVSPRKSRIVLDLVRGKDVTEAREILTFCERAVSETVLKTLNSAVANAVNNNNLAESSLVIVEAVADEGPTLKRIRPRAKGSASRINKRTSHIKITVASGKEA
jgi:large subunit ribosomal protein L22